MATLAPAPRAATADGPLVLYDGYCGLCDRSVRWLVKADRRALLSFAPLQGETAAPILARHGIPATEEFRTMLTIENPGAPNERIHTRSDGAIAALAVVGGGWGRLARAARWVPRILRDAVYDFVARHRFRWFGRLDACRIPTPDERARFLP